jgi:hypothetical protein
MKDLLNKLVAADEGVADQSTCIAVKFQTCKIDGTQFGCAPNLSCNFVNELLISNNPGATEQGNYCQQHTLEAELMEESQYLQDASDDCRVLGPENGGCTPIEFPGLSCKEGFRCDGYEQSSGVQDATLGTCVAVTNRSDEEHPSDTLVCNGRLYDLQHPCDTVADCDAVNPRNCEVRCANGVCAAPTFEEEKEELAASDDQEDYDDVPADAAHCLPSGAACSLDNGGNEVLTDGKRCCGMTGPDTWTHNGASCNFFNNRHAVGNSDAGAGAYCVYNPGEDLAVN